MTKFLTSNSALYRTLRTVLQGIIGVLIANLDVLIAPLTISDSFKPIIVALCMAVLSPIMAEIGRTQEAKMAPREDGSYYIVKGRNESNDKE